MGYAGASLIMLRYLPRCLSCCGSQLHSSTSTLATSIAWPAISSSLFTTHLVDTHQLLRCVFDIPVQRRELDLLRIPAHVPERSLDRVQIVRTDSDETTLTTQVLVKLVLQVNEGFVFEVVERSAQAEDTGGEVRSKRSGLIVSSVR